MRKNHSFQLIFRPSHGISFLKKKMNMEGPKILAGRKMWFFHEFYFVF